MLTHGDRLTVGGTTLLLHIHPGNDTCYDCEPGLVQAQEPHSDLSGEGRVENKIMRTSVSMTFCHFLVGSSVSYRVRKIIYKYFVR